MGKTVIICIDKSSPYIAMWGAFVSEVLTMLTGKILKLAKAKGKLRSSGHAEIGASSILLAYLAKIRCSALDSIHRY